MEQIEAKVRLLEAAAKAYGGASSVHFTADAVAEMAKRWYNDLDNWKKPDTAPSSSTLKLPKK